MYKKAGVTLSKLVPAGQQPRRLFGAADYERSGRLMEAVDGINAKYGRDTIRFGVLRPGGRWQTKSLKRSRRYTTCLQEVLRIT